jgi:Zn-dependent alcohol dehydrogenase
LQIARAFGASAIIAVDVQDDKLQKAKTFGATHTINAIQEDAVEKIRVCFYLSLQHLTEIKVPAQCIFLNYDLNF